MADGLLSQIHASMEHAVQQAAKQMFGGGSGGTNLDAIRWEGMSNAQLAAAVRLLGEGPGAAAITQAADALSTVAQNLQQIDSTLHDQLQVIGVNWQSQASELAQEMTTSSAAYSGAAGAAGGASSAGVTNQGDAYSAAKNAVPNVSDLQSPSGSFLDNTGALLTGHQNDHATQVSQTNAARQKAVDCMKTYGQSSQTGLAAHQPLPTPPGYAVTPKPVDPGIGQITTVSGYVPPPAGVPGGSGGGGGMPTGPSGGGGGGMPGMPGAPGVPGMPFPGGGGASSGAAPGGVAGGLPGEPVGGFAGGGVPGGGLPGGSAGGLPVVGMPSPVVGAPLRPGVPLGGGPVSGVGPIAGPSSAAGIASAAQSSAIAGSVVEDAAVGAAIIGGTAGAGIAGASARPDKLVRSRLAGEPVEDEGFGARQQTARALAELEGEEAEAAGISARIGATAEPPPSLLEPAVAGRAREDDERHDNRYGVDTELFGDGRMVVPPVLDSAGDTDPTQSK